MPVVALVAWFGHDVIHWAEVHGALAAAITVAVVAGIVFVRRSLRARRG
jgi:hypothetical protein